MKKVNQVTRDFNGQKCDCFHVGNQFEYRKIQCPQGCKHPANVVSAGIFEDSERVLIIGWLTDTGEFLERFRLGPPHFNEPEGVNLLAYAPEVEPDVFAEWVAIFHRAVSELEAWERTPAQREGNHLCRQWQQFAPIRGE